MLLFLPQFLPWTNFSQDLKIPPLVSAVVTGCEPQGREYGFRHEGVPH